MKIKTKIWLFLILTSLCYGTPIFLLEVAQGDVYTSHQYPITDSTLDIGSAVLLWRYIYGDAFTDGTFLITGGVITGATWNGAEIDISDYTNLIGGTNITLSDDTINVDDAFLVNDASDTTTGTITAAGFTTTGTLDTSVLVVDTDTLVANLSGYANKVGIGTATIGGVGNAKLQIKGTDGSAAGPHVVFETDADTYPLMHLLLWTHDNMDIFFDAYWDGASKSSDAGSNALIQKYGDELLFRYDSGVAQGGAVTWNDAITVDLTDGKVETDVFVVGSNPPASTGAAGTAGTITYDSSYIYVCVANNSWKRAALSTWAVTDILLLDDGASKLFLDDGSSYLLIRP